MSQQCVPWQPKGPAMSWGASNTAWLASWGRWLSHSYWCDPTLSTVCSFGHLWALQYKKDIKLLKGPEEGEQGGERPRRQDLGGASQVTWFVQHRGGWGVTSLQSTTPSRRAVEGEMQISSLWWPAIRHEEMEWSCIKASSNRTLGKRSSLREWLVTRMGCSEEWSRH